MVWTNNFCVLDITPVTSVPPSHPCQEDFARSRTWEVRPMNHRRLFALGSIAVSSTLAIATTATAAVPNDHTAATGAAPQPTAAARAAGITKAGEAHMGWSRPRTPSTAKPAA